MWNLYTLGKGLPNILKHPQQTPFTKKNRTENTHQRDPVSQYSKLQKPKLPVSWHPGDQTLLQTH